MTHNNHPCIAIPNAYEISEWSTDAAGAYPIYFGTDSPIHLSNGYDMYYAYNFIDWPSGTDTYATIRKQ